MEFLSRRPQWVGSGPHRSGPGTSAMEREADIMLRCSVLPRTATSGRLQKVTGDVEIVPYCPDPGPQAMTDRETELQKLVAIYGADERLPSQEQWRKVIAVDMPVQSNGQRLGLKAPVQKRGRDTASSPRR
jgi:hypothetical protein